MQLPLLPEEDPCSHPEAPGTTTALIAPAATCYSLMALWVEGPGSCHVLGP